MKKQLNIVFVIMLIASVLGACKESKKEETKIEKESVSNELLDDGVFKVIANNSTLYWKS